VIESIFFNPWIWIIPIVLGILLMCVIACIIATYMADEFWIMGAVIGGIFFLMVGGFYFGAVLPPYDTSYYQTYRITGELESLESAFNGEEGTMSQVFVAEVDGIETFIRSDDQRFRTLEPGDQVNLVCSKEFRYFQQYWYECSFGGL
jgi:hypothetical protein